MIGARRRRRVTKRVVAALRRAREAKRRLWQEQARRRFPRYAKLLTAKQLARKCGVSPVTIYRWRQSGLPTFRVGRAVYFDVRKVRRWLLPYRE